jgi:hypothetical protein
MIFAAFFQKYTAYIGTNNKPATPHQPITCVVNEISFTHTNDHNTKNKLIKKVNVTKTMWKDLSDIKEEMKG